MLATAQDTPFRVMLGNGKPFNIPLEYLKWIFRVSDHTIPAITLALLESVNKISKGMIKKFVAMGNELKQELCAEIGESGLLLYPSYPTPAPPHNSRW